MPVVRKRAKPVLPLEIWKSDRIRNLLPEHLPKIAKARSIGDFYYSRKYYCLKPGVPHRSGMYDWPYFVEAGIIQIGRAYAIVESEARDADEVVVAEFIEFGEIEVPEVGDEE